MTEAIAHGVSVICSDLVGAKQFLSEKDIFKHDSAEDLANCMLKSHAVPQVSQDMISMERHTLQIKKSFVFCMLNEGIENEEDSHVSIFMSAR